MVPDVNQTRGDHFTTHINRESLCYTLETSIMLHVNYTSIKKSPQNPKNKMKIFLSLDMFFLKDTHVQISPIRNNRKTSPWMLCFHLATITSLIPFRGKFLERKEYNFCLLFPTTYLK